MVKVPGVIKLKELLGNTFKGYLSCKPGFPLDFASVTFDKSKVLTFCVTPFGYFAEDNQDLENLLHDSSFVLQQISSERKKLTDRNGKLCLLETDIYNQTDNRTKICLEVGDRGRLHLCINGCYIHNGEGQFLNLSNEKRGALQFELQVVSSKNIKRICSLVENVSRHIFVSEAH